MLFIYYVVCIAVILWPLFEDKLLMAAFWRRLSIVCSKLEVHIGLLGMAAHAEYYRAIERGRL